MIVMMLDSRRKTPCDGSATGGEPHKAATIRREDCFHAYCDACRAAIQVEPCAACAREAAVATAARQEAMDLMRSGRLGYHGVSDQRRLTLTLAVDDTAFDARAQAWIQLPRHLHRQILQHMAQHPGPAEAVLTRRVAQTGKMEFTLQFVEGGQ